MTQTQTLYSTVVKLSPQTKGVVPVNQGRLNHAAFLELIRRVDPNLSAELHAENQRRPFTSSFLQGVGRGKNGHVRIRPGQRPWLRFTFLGDELFTTFSRYLLNPARSAALLPGLRLGQVDFAITEMLTTPGSDAWAGYITTANLDKKWRTARLDKNSYKISLKFPSGVVFSRNSKKEGLKGSFMEFYPFPAMFFGSVAAKLSRQTTLPAPMDNKALREYVKETVVVSRFDLKTMPCHYHKGKPQFGAVGQISYELRDTANDEMVGFLNLLADFAFYSGVGAKTTMGMGQVSRVVY